MSDEFRLGDYTIRRTQFGWAAHRPGRDYPYTWVDPFPAWPGNLLNLALAEIERLQAESERMRREVDDLRTLIRTTAENQLRMLAATKKDDALIAAATKEEGE